MTACGSQASARVDAVYSGPASDRGIDHCMAALTDEL